MTITLTEKNAQGQSQRYDARHLDDAATPAAATFYPGFRPKSVVAVNLTDRITYEWHQGMAFGDYLKTVAAGTRTLETDNLLEVETDTGERASVFLAASIVLQNKQYQIIAEA